MHLAKSYSSSWTPGETIVYRAQNYLWVAREPTFYHVVFTFANVGTRCAFFPPETWQIWQSHFTLTDGCLDKDLECTPCGYLTGLKHQVRIIPGSFLKTIDVALNPSSLDVDVDRTTVLFLEAILSALGLQSTSEELAQSTYRDYDRMVQRDRNLRGYSATWDSKETLVLTVNAVVRGESQQNPGLVHATFLVPSDVHINPCGDFTPDEIGLWLKHYKLAGPYKTDSCSWRCSHQKMKQWVADGEFRAAVHAAKPWQLDVKRTLILLLESCLFANSDPSIRDIYLRLVGEDRDARLKQTPPSADVSSARAIFEEPQSVQVSEIDTEPSKCILVQELRNNVLESDWTKFQEQLRWLSKTGETTFRFGITPVPSDKPEKGGSPNGNVVKLSGRRLAHLLSRAAQEGLAVSTEKSKVSWNFE